MVSGKQCSVTRRLYYIDLILNQLCIGVADWMKAIKLWAGLTSSLTAAASTTGLWLVERNNSIGIASYLTRNPGY